MLNNKNKAGIKYYIKDASGTMLYIMEHEFKHYIRHNNLKNDDYNIAGFSTITNGYIVYVNKEAINYNPRTLNRRK
jgi:hypothetical protein